MTAPRPADRALLAEALRRYLRQHGLTPIDLARASAFSLVEIESWLAASHFPDAAQLRCLHHMGVDLGPPAEPSAQPEYWIRYARFLAAPHRMLAGDTLLALWDFLQASGLPCTLLFDANGQVQIDILHQLQPRGRVGFQVEPNGIRFRFVSPFLRDTVVGDWVPLTLLYVERLVALGHQVLTQAPILTAGTVIPGLG